MRCSNWFVLLFVVPSLGGIGLANAQVAGEPCTVGVGICQNTGVFVDEEESPLPVCSVDPFPPETEGPLGITCHDGLDNDCDGLTDSFDAASCSEDTTRPTISCPDDITAVASGSGGAVVDYLPTVSDDDPDVTFACDPASGSTFPPGSTPVTCTATDTSGNSDSCSFDVTVEVAVSVDIKPGGCPNSLPLAGRGALPVAILGTASFDVTTIDPASVQLQGVASLRATLEDVATPFNGAVIAHALDCTTLGADGFNDLVLIFDAEKVAAALGAVENGDVLLLEVVGNLIGGEPIRGHDVVVIRKQR